MGKAACRGQGAQRLQPCGQVLEAMLRAEETGLREDLGSHFCKPQAGAHPGKAGKGEETEEGGWLWLCPHCPRDHLGLPIRSAKPALRMGWQCPIHPRGFLDSGCAGWCPMCTKSPHTVERDFPFSPLPPHHPALPTPPLPRELHCRSPGGGQPRKGLVGTPS